MISGTQEYWYFGVMNDVIAYTSQYCAAYEACTPAAQDDYGGFFFWGYFTNLLSWFALFHLESYVKLQNKNE